MREVSSVLKSKQYITCKFKGVYHFGVSGIVAGPDGI